jgi:hypothetical protein
MKQRFGKKFLKTILSLIMLMPALLFAGCFDDGGDGWTPGDDIYAAAMDKKKNPIWWASPLTVIGEAADNFSILSPPNLASDFLDRLNRKQETSIGDLLCDGIAVYVRNRYPEENIDFVFLYGAIMDGDAGIGGLDKGKIKLSRISGMFLQTDKLSVITMSGVDIKELFERVAETPHNGSGGMYVRGWGMPSKEVRYTINYTLRPLLSTECDDYNGVLENLTFKGQEFDDDKYYRFCTSNRLIDDPWHSPSSPGLTYPGYSDILKRGTDRSNLQVLFYPAFAEYIYYAYDTPIVPRIDGRVKLIGGIF